MIRNVSTHLHEDKKAAEVLIEVDTLDEAINLLEIMYSFKKFLKSGIDAETINKKEVKNEID